MDSVDRQGNRNLIQAAIAAGVEQFVFTSFLGADINSYMELFRAKAEIEACLKASRLPYTVLAPNYFIESWAGMIVGMPLQAHQPITLVGEGRRQHSLISVGDVAAFAAAAVDHGAAIGRRIPIGGPEPLTWRGIVALFGQALGQELPVKSVAPGEPIPGLPDVVPAALASMETYDSVIVMDAWARLFGVKQTPAIDVVRRMLGLPVQ